MSSILVVIFSVDHSFCNNSFHIIVIFPLNILWFYTFTLLCFNPFFIWITITQSLKLHINSWLTESIQKTVNFEWKYLQNLNDIQTWQLALGEDLGQCLLPETVMGMRFFCGKVDNKKICQDLQFKLFPGLICM